MTRFATLAVVAALGQPACTFGLPLTTAGVIGIHNASVDHREDKWSYTGPIVVTAVAGLLVDFVIFKKLQQMWSKPMS